ncbi:hypothetical protein RN001_012170 [Aquatica leii]|uniref:Major facilitator superfamily (MFS) profile domain-containing protein n=1 Tax=Aquatica leii TaxID=1421715 RepID=A0AAN7QEL6_9COLE|nr:hypothetical protein RN001_012170 [Aquatica leii]
MSKPENRTFLYISVCIGNLVAMTAGIALGWTSPVSPKLSDPTNLENNPFGRLISSEEDSWIGSLLAVGAIIGPFAAGYSADKLGRKKTLLLFCGIPFLVSFLMLAFAKTVVLYYIARFLAGFGVGGVFTVLPNFNSEIAEDSIRGAISSSMNVFVVAGPLFAYVIGPITSIMWFNLICAVIPAAFLILFFLIVPESPYYLIAINDSVGAVKSLKQFRSTNDSSVNKEMQNMKLMVDEATSNKASFTDIFKSRGLVKALIISLSLVGFQQFSGINVVLFYSQTVFEATGSSISSEIPPMIVGAVQLGASFVTPLVVDRLGRKMLHLISAIGMFIAEVVLGLYFYLQISHDVTSIFWLPILCLIVYIIFYNLGFGPLPWTVMAEIFPSNIKSIASTATASFCWILGFIITKFFSSISVQIGMAGSFWLFSGFCLLAIVFVATFVIETKGKSFQEIQDILAR